MNYFEKVKTQPIKEDAIIMGIETSCDETAAAVVKNGRTVLSNVIFSEIIFTAFLNYVDQFPDKTRGINVTSPHRNDLSGWHILLK